MDMALIRLISNVASREVIVFVNRIDELPDPANQIVEIRNSIRETLRKANGPSEVEVLFGSAYWANMALGGDLGQLDRASAQSLVRLGEALFGARPVPVSAQELVWELSGVPSLFAAISQRIAEGPAFELVEAVRRQALNLALSVRASTEVVSMRLDGEVARAVDRGDLTRRLTALQERHLGQLSKALSEAARQFNERVDQSHDRFLSRALESLLTHLETKGEEELWQYSADGLRVLLRSSYLVLGRNYAAECERVFKQAAADLTQAYLAAFDIRIDGFRIEPPEVPAPPAPISLGKTIVLDLHTSWWKSWWKRRRGYRAYASSFLELIEAETTPLVSELKKRETEEIARKAMRLLADFLEEQCEQLISVARHTEVGRDELNKVFGIALQDGRMQLLESIIEFLGGSPETLASAAE
jgi:hypothetical protein